MAVSAPRNADIRLHVLAIAGAISGYHRWSHGEWAIWPLVAAAVVIAYFTLVPRAMLPLANALMAGVRPVGHVNNMIVLSVLFYGILTPLGLLMRALRGERIEVRRGKGRESYWKRRDKGEDIDFTKMY